MTPLYPAVGYDEGHAKMPEGGGLREDDQQGKQGAWARWGSRVLDSQSGAPKAVVLLRWTLVVSR